MKTAGDILKDKDYELISVTSDKTVQETCKIMVDNKIGAVVIKENGVIVGIWTERDLLRNITMEGFVPETARVGDYMTTALHTVSDTTAIPRLEELFLGLFVRHLIVEKEGKKIGLISIGDVLRASLIEKDEKFKELNAFVSWEYYEDWKWGRKKRR
jgi:predicted transcriptional regulator